jgi:nitroimidazol reductase NimA-like FMN-containing flavoprotein (pyridoxamine 5'-phosphate oxidase superfamily)
VTLDAALAREDFCYVTTTGRRSGKPHTIEIWFGTYGSTVYMLHDARERSDTVRNARRMPEVSVRIGDRTLAGRARVVEPATDEDALARRLLLEKYGPGYDGDLTRWGREALPLAIDLAV